MRLLRALKVVWLRQWRLQTRKARKAGKIK